MFVKCQHHGDGKEDSHAVDLTYEQMRMVIYAYGAGIAQLNVHGQILPLCIKDILANIDLVWTNSYKARRARFYPHFPGDDEYGPDVSDKMHEELESEEAPK